MDNNSNPQASPPSPDNPQPQPPAATPATPQQQQLVKVGDFPLTPGELVLFQHIYNSFDQQRQLIAMLMAEKHGFPERDPIAFEFNWQNKTVTAYRPSSIEVAGGEPPKPAENQAA